MADATLDTLVESNATRIRLHDLVMLQMMGELPEFLHLFNNGREYQKLIDRIDSNVTTKQVFKEIVHRSIENQFGEPLVALRELVQNGLDAYDPDQRKEIKISYERGPEYHTITVEDNGVGMSQLELLRDLLIPYNSGSKEANMEKIGEHGIGWYSTLDLAEIVEVFTATRKGDKTNDHSVKRSTESIKTMENQQVLLYNPQRSFQN